MERDILKALEAWKTSENRKPLVLRGARQVGKTWCLKEFGRRSFETCAYLRLEDNAAAAALFEGSLDPQRLILGIAALTNTEIQPEKTLIVLDEVQAVPRALTALKYFCEDAPEYCIAVAGSLLGVAMHAGVSFPVGKVDFLDLYPMSFTEFLEATGEEAAVQFIRQQNTDMISVFAEQLTDALRRYYYVGGMPEAVESFRLRGDFAAVRSIQKSILAGYEGDFSKHISGALSGRCRLVWDSLPHQLAKENKRFVYGAVREGARAREFEEAIQVLVDSGLVLKVPRISKPGLPLAAYSDPQAFKLYLLDVGLLGALTGLDSSTILEGSSLFAEFKGVMAEQYVCQQLVSECGLAPYYWSAEKSSGEVDFVVQLQTSVLPIEVKAETNLKAKSLRSFCERYGIDTAVRLSLAGLQDQGWVRNIPLYAVPLIEPSPAQPPALHTA